MSGIVSKKPVSKKARVSRKNLEDKRLESQRNNYKEKYMGRGFAWDVRRSSKYRTHSDPLKNLSIRERDFYDHILLPLLGNRAFDTFKKNRGKSGLANEETFVVKYLGAEWKKFRPEYRDMILGHFKGRPRELSALIKKWGGAKLFIREFGRQNKRFGRNVVLTISWLKKNAPKKSLDYSYFATKMQNNF